MVCCHALAQDAEWNEWRRRLVLKQLELSPSLSLQCVFVLTKDAPDLAFRLFLPSFSCMWVQVSTSSYAWDGRTSRS